MDAKQVADFSQRTLQTVAEGGTAVTKVLYACNLNLHEISNGSWGNDTWYDLPIFEDTIIDQMVAEGYCSISTDQVELTVLQDIRIEFVYSIETQKTESNNRTESEVRVLHHTGGSYTELEDCTRKNYNRQSNLGATEASNAPRPLVMLTGEKLKIQFRKVRGSGRIGIQPRRASFYAKKI